MRRTSSLSPCATSSRTTTTESRPIATRRLRSPWPEVGGKCAGGGRCDRRSRRMRQPLLPRTTTFCTRHGSGMASRCRARSIVDERLARFEHERLQRLGPIEQPRHVADGLGDQRYACGARNRWTLHCARLNCWGTFGGLALELLNTTEQERSIRINGLREAGQLRTLGSKSCQPHKISSSISAA
jgi:hypothetical protein